MISSWMTSLYVNGVDFVMEMVDMMKHGCDFSLAVSDLKHHQHPCTTSLDFQCTIDIYTHFNNGFPVNHAINLQWK